MVEQDKKDQPNQKSLPRVTVKRTTNPPGPMTFDDGPAEFGAMNGTSI
jgi:hypothetical protein